MCGGDTNIMKGKLSVDYWIYLIIGVVVLFTVVAQLYPTLVTAGDSLNASGIPLGTFFASGGLIFLLLAVGLLILIVKSFMGHTHK